MTFVEAEITSRIQIISDGFDQFEIVEAVVVFRRGNVNVEQGNASYKAVKKAEDKRKKKCDKTLHKKIFILFFLKKLFDFHLFLSSLNEALIYIGHTGSRI